MTDPIREARAMKLPDGQLVAVALRPFTAEELARILEIHPDAVPTKLVELPDPPWNGYDLRLHPSLEVAYSKTHWTGTTNITIKRKKDYDDEEQA